MKTFDVAIVGGGVIGASIAFDLASRSLNVVVLDRQTPGLEASWAAAGMLSPRPDSPRDIPLTPLGKESLRLHPQFVAEVEEASGQCVNYAREGALEILFAPRGESDCDQIISELYALGIAAESVSSAAGVWERSIAPGASAAIWLPEEGTVEPRLLIGAVLAAAQNRGAQIIADFPVTELLLVEGRCIGVASRGEKISARHVVLAAGSFCSEIAGSKNLASSYAPTRPVRGQMLALRPPDRLKLQRVLRSERGYLVPRKDGRIVAGSTAEEAGFEKRVTAAGIRKILDAALELCPALANAEVIESWCGLRPGTPDDLPILGPTDIEALIIATGHYRNGILLAPVTAKLVGEWIVNGRTAFDAKPFSPLRFGRMAQLDAAAQSAD